LRSDGQTTLHELAFGVTGINPRCGTPVNPRFPALIPGGSSSGSAAVVASGEVDFSLGTGGSVRMPAACCGVMGLKPGYGVLSRQGVMPAESSLDCVGVFTRDAAVLRQVMTRLSVPVDAPLNDLPPMAFVLAAEPDIDALILSALLRPGFLPQEITLPLLEEAHRAGLTLISHENWLALGPLLASGAVSPDVASRIRAGADVSREALEQAEKVRVAFSEHLDAVLEQTPLLALATLPELPPTLQESTRSTHCRQPDPTGTPVQPERSSCNHATGG
jgi:amidase